MLIAAVVITLCIVLSSAQPPECIAAYNAVFTSADDEAINCTAAYYAALTNSATNEQTAMVCNVGQQCNSMIENIITQCGDMVTS